MSYCETRCDNWTYTMENFQCHRLLYILALKINKLLLFNYYYILTECDTVMISCVNLIWVYYHYIYWWYSYQYQDTINFLLCLWIVKICLICMYCWTVSGMSFIHFNKSCLNHNLPSEQLVLDRELALLLNGLAVLFPLYPYYCNRNTKTVKHWFLTKCLHQGPAWLDHSIWGCFC